MTHTSLYLTVLIFISLVLSSTSLPIILSETKNIEVEVDHIYSQTIPSIFDLYQSSQLSNLTRLDSPQTIITQPICTIQDQQDSQYIEESQYFHFDLADPEKFYLGRRKAASFQDLIKLNGIIDTIIVDQKVIVLFQNGFYTSYSIKSTDGKIKTEFVKLLGNQSDNIPSSYYGKNVYKNVVAFGDLLHDQSNPQYVLFIGQEQAYIMDKKNQRFQPLKGFTPIGISYEKAFISDKTIYVAAGQQGVIIYEVDYVYKEIKQKQKFKPFIMDDQSELSLIVTDIVYDSVQKNLILADQSEGIHWVTIPPVQQTKILCQPNPVLLQNCQNLNLIQRNPRLLIATCPSFIMIVLDSKKYHVNDEIQFYPQSVVVNQSKVLLFGQYRYAVYDIDTALVQQGQSQRRIDFVLFSKQHIVMVNTFAIYVGKILPDQEKLVCAASERNSQNIVGKYNATLQIIGMCSQIYPQKFILKSWRDNPLLPNQEDRKMISNIRNLKDNCYITYNVQISVTDSSKVSYFWQIVGAIVIVWILIGGLIAYCVKDIKVQKEYNQLLEENVPTSANEKDKQMMTQNNENTVEEIFQK